MTISPHISEILTILNAARARCVEAEPGAHQASSCFVCDAVGEVEKLLTIDTVPTDTDSTLTLIHRLWTWAVGAPGYNKGRWLTLEDRVRGMEHVIATYNAEARIGKRGQHVIDVEGRLLTSHSYLMSVKPNKWTPEPEVELRKIKQADGNDLWLVKWAGVTEGPVLNRFLEWEYNSLPSSRDDEEIRRTRYRSIKEVVEHVLRWEASL